MKRLLLATAVIETAAGVALAVAPSLTARALFGPSLVLSASTLVLVRLAGAIPLALGVAHWLVLRRETGRAARGLVIVMTIYNLGAATALAGVGLFAPPGGPLLWPAVLLHAVMTAWCACAILGARRKTNSDRRGAP